ncbi:redoxin domain-containing protein [Nonomuraea sp. MG754425]|uniref:TlpA family protein disulfide reductase n=1 Tax=Nonomuraea sp. MG754425 TaxID=2570319 RepID=UPI001F254082|nr:thioredoxin domain-containing protein [Nonomuraea sp. MG754425]MCF6470444.1 redoxin domain-containing protein [Nonomuraea sp. MG754425]
MPYLIVAVVLIGVLCLLNLLLTVGVIRRLRRQAAAPGMAYPSPVAEGLAVGERMPGFAATTTDGEPISDELLDGPVLVGFFSPACQPCQELMPHFVQHARRAPETVFAVVVADSADEAAADVARLSEVARVVVEAPQAAIQTAFKVSGYPTVMTFGADRTVTGHDPIRPAGAPA